MTKLNKTTPFDTVSIDSSEKQKKEEKERVDKLLNGNRKENFCLWFFRRTICSMECFFITSLILLLVVIALLIWGTCYLAGFIIMNDILDHHGEFIVKDVSYKVEDLMSLPMEIVQHQKSVFDSLNFTMNQNASELVTFSHIAFHSIRNNNKTFAGLYIGTKDNDFINLTPTTTGFSMTYGINATEITSGINYDHNLKEIEKTNSTYTFRPITRPWYIESANKKRLGVSAVYSFYGLVNNLGITYTYPIIKNNEVEMVFGSDYNLKLLNELLRPIEVGKTGSIFIVEKSGYLVASSKEVILINDDGVRQYATECSDEDQRIAAKVIQERIGFENINTHYETTYSGMKVTAMPLNPKIKSTEDTLLTEPWLLVTHYPTNRDYLSNFYIAIYLALGISIVIIIIAIIVSIILLTCLFVIPLNILIKDMKKLRTFDLEKIPKRFKNPIYEIREVQKAFYTTLEFLKMYKTFLPSYILEDVNENDHEAKSDDESEKSENSSTHKSVTSTYYSKNSSHKTTKSSKAYVIYEKAVKNLKKFEIGIEHGEGTVLVVYLLFSKEVINSNPKDFVEQHSRFSSIIENIIRIHSGSLDRFSEYKFVSTFFDLKKAINAAIEIRKKLDSIVSQFKTQFSQHIDYSIGICTGDISIAVLGSQKTRNKRVFGSAVEKAEYLSELGDEWPTKIILDKFTSKKVDRKKWIVRPVTIPNGSSDPIFEVFCSTIVKSNEWLYEKHDENKIEAISYYKKGFTLMEDNKLDEALSMFNTFLEIHENDNITMKHIENIEKMKKE